MTRLFEKEYGLPVNSNPTDPRSRVRTFRMAALCSPIIASRQHRLHSSNRCVGRTLTNYEEAVEICVVSRFHSSTAL